MAKQIEQNKGKNVPIAGKYSLDDVKSFFYLMNAKPDTSIQLLEGRKKITLAEIRDLNERIQRKLQNHDLIGQIASINLIFEKGKIQDYSTWAEFERETWHTINNKTDAISLTWDISVKLPRYENPQRHTLKVRIGQAVSPKDMIELVFSSDDPSELREKRADGIVKVDFIDQVIAGELIEKVVNWYEGLKKVPNDIGFQKIMEKNQRLIISTIFNFTPILFLAVYHYYFLAFCEWGSSISNITIANIQLFLIVFVAIFFFGKIFASKFAKWIDKKIDEYTRISQFEISKGDENAFHDSEAKNNSITKKIVMRGFLTIVSTAIAFTLRHLLELWIK
tara:strand:- start:671 stop:1678 length:1008 start_codon:yes stop_codon:yes gene_type:complete